MQSKAIFIVNVCKNSKSKMLYGTTKCLCKERLYLILNEYFTINFRNRNNIILSLTLSFLGRASAKWAPKIISSKLNMFYIFFCSSFSRIVICLQGLPNSLKYTVFRVNVMIPQNYLIFELASEVYGFPALLNSLIILTYWLAFHVRLMRSLISCDIRNFQKINSFWRVHILRMRILYSV